MTDSPSPQSFNVLVSVASRHGATAEIAVRLQERFEAAGMTVTVADPEHTDEIDGYDVVVLGSAVYAGHWLSSAQRMARRVAEADPKPTIWLLSSGPIGDPPMPDEDPVDVAGILTATSAQEHRVFAGKVDHAKLNLAEKAIMKAIRAPQGDFRDWEAIDAWADRIIEVTLGQVASKDPISASSGPISTVKGGGE